MTLFSRRRFVALASTSWALAGVIPRVPAAARPSRAAQSVAAPLVVSTWPFGRPANDAALAALARGGSGLDAIEQGIRLTEADPGNSSVGLAGIPNSAGVVQLDACLMSGPGHRAGSVAAVEGYRHPISIARRVMEKTRHVMLVGKGAMDFAAAEGLERGPRVSPGQRAEWRRWKDRQARERRRPGSRDDHDTIAMVLLLPDGNLFGGCSTSGLGYKLPGRVGDSPILGSGLYVDNEVGAAGATGIGENVMRFCGSFLVVEYMRQGLHPEDACVETIRRIARLDPKGFDLAINFVAIDKKGRFGAAGTGSGFEYAVATRESSQVFQSPGLTEKSVGPVGGNRVDGGR
ncbi:MAG: N(4)-(beta-N-acetylglucosaminyl)-L-asparaginase [Verrucomicrobiota bacterium]